MRNLKNTVWKTPFGTLRNITRSPLGWLSTRKGPARLGWLLGFGKVISGTEKSADDPPP